MRRALATALAMLAAVALAACTTSDVLEPSAMVGPSPAAPAPAAAPTPLAATPIDPAASASTTAAIAPANARLQIAPIVGSTVAAVTPLTERLAQTARARGIGLAGGGDPATTHVLKGYFSAISEGGSTTVIYVWDVLDPAGNRLHRIQGQQKAEGGGEGWPSVGAGTMQTIADTTIAQFTAWLAASAG